MLFLCGGVWVLAKKQLSNGHTISYLEIGEGTPLLLIPATGVDHTVWGDHLSAFAKHFRVFAIDNLGTGDSSKIEDVSHYTEEVLADDAFELMKSLNIDSAHVAGISMGSIVAQRVAIEHPGFVRSLSLYNSWGKTDDFMEQIFSIWQRLIETQPMSFAGPSMLHWLVSEALWEEHPEQIPLLSKMVFESETAPPTFVTLAHLEIDIAHDALDELRYIQAPTLIIAGEEDRTTPVRYAKEMVEQIPNAELQVITGRGSSHLLMNERAEEFQSIAINFLINQDKKVNTLS